MIAVIGIVLVVVLAAAIAANSVRGRLGWSAVVVPPEELAATLRPAFRWIVPEGDGPFPAAILLSGCDGPKPNLDRLGRTLAEAGWLSLIVDSHGPRGLDRLQAWRLVCAGQVFNGAERASDIAVALAELRGDPRVRPADISLVGFSHGGWAALDFLALSERGTPPPLLSRWPDGLTVPPHDAVRSVALYYPYCGLASVGADATLPVGPAYLFLLVTGDSIADDADCGAVAERLAREGGDVTVRRFDGVTHGFDQVEKSALSTLDFDAAATEEATRLTVGFLRDKSAPRAD